MIYNDYLGIRKYLGLEVTASLKFNLEITMDDNWVYPSFGNFDIIDPKVTKKGNGVGIVGLENLPKRLQDLAEWVRRDFNKWHEDVVD